MADKATAKTDPSKAQERRRGARSQAPAPQPRSLRGSVPALTPARAQALRGFFSKRHSWLLADSGLMQLFPGRPAEAGQTFELDGEGVRLGLRLQATAVAIGDGLHWSDFQGRSRILAWSLAHEGHLMRLSEILGVALTPLLETGDDADGQAQDTVWLEFLIDDEHPEDDPDAARRAPALQGSLRLPATWLERLLNRAEPPFEGEPPPPLGRWGELPATVSVQLPVPPLSAAEWAGLRPGDVFVVGRRSQPPAFQAHACGRLWPLAPTSQGWRVEAAAQPLPRMQETPPMTEHQAPGQDDAEDKPAAATDPDAAARELPVQIAFEIGRLEMPVGKLAELQPGYVFPVPAQLEGANVTIRANGQAVGEGELVSVGDTLGVRLLSWR